MKVIKVLIVCGTSIATATIGATKIREEFERRKIPVEVQQTKTMEVASKISYIKPDLVVAMAQIEDDISCPKISGIPLLTNVGLDSFWNQLFSLLQESGKLGG